MGTITVVTSGKGGAGKSTVSAGLGCALADLGHKVLLLDGDAGLRSLDLMLGVSSATVYDMSDVFAGRCEPVRAIYPSPICRDVSVIAAPVHLEQLCSPEDMRRLCQSFVQHFDDLIIDCPAGIGSGFEAAVAAADRALVVTTPDLVCARDANIVSDLLEAKGIPARLVINRLRARPIRKGKTPDIDTLIDMAGIRLIGVLPDDEQVATANANGNPLPLQSAAHEAFANIARRLQGENVPLMDLNR
ncbi:MAG: septum site-determining protein MinD [Clostridia bacterium]|nr:septum site-determining protein MinD [Clostridia bacterium]